MGNEVSCNIYEWMNEPINESISIVVVLLRINF